MMVVTGDSGPCCGIPDSIVLVLVLVVVVVLEFPFFTAEDDDEDEDEYEAPDAGAAHRTDLLFLRRSLLDQLPQHLEAARDRLVGGGVRDAGVRRFLGEDRTGDDEQLMADRLGDELVV